MAGKTPDQLQADYDAALAAEHDNPGDERKRAAASRASDRLTQARTAARSDRTEGVTLAGDVTPADGSGE